jgi:hypothetical protein
MLPLALVRRAAATLRAAALAVAGCRSTAAPLPRAGAPGALEFSVGGFGADGRTVLVRVDTVLLWRTPWDRGPGADVDTVRVVPTPDAWRTFWRAANRAGVRRWRERYMAEGVVDGTGWSLCLDVGDTVIESTGSNAYPDRQGGEHELEMTDDFRALMTALGELVGEPL